MESTEHSTHEKALAINLDHNIYGTIAEIGAGQEVSRWFFRVGGAAGTVAKSISAYDMTVSDQIYGKVGRFVSRERVLSMLDVEFRLLRQRLGDGSIEGRRLFAFADTVAARNYAGTNECHGWLGIRFEHVAGNDPSEIMLHVNMRDDTNIAQQEAIGILGVNLVHSAFHCDRQVDPLFEGLYEHLELARLEVDLVELSGPAFETQDHIETAIALVTRRMAPATVLMPGGELAPPTEVLRKRPIVVSRSLAPEPSAGDRQRLIAARDLLPREAGELDRETLPLLELNIGTNEGKGIGDHVTQLVALGEAVLLTGLPEAYQLTSYMRRYSHAPLRFVLDVSTLAYVMHERHYGDVPGGVLEAVGKLFAANVKVYATDMPREEMESRLAALGVDSDFLKLDDQDMISPHHIHLKPPANLLYQYLVDMGWFLRLEMPEPDENGNL